MHKIIRRTITGQDFIDLADAADLSDADIVRLSGLPMPEVFKIHEGIVNARMSDIIIMNFLAKFPDFKPVMLEIAAENTISVQHTSQARQERRAALREA